MLPDPLLTFDLYDQFVQQGAYYSEIVNPTRKLNTESERKASAQRKQLEAKMESLVNQLPEVNRAVLCFLLEFLNEITAKARENACADEHACARSLAWVFAQACLRPDIKHGQSLATRGECEVVMVQLIMQNKQLFSSGSEVKIIKRAKLKNQLQASTQSLHLTNQIADQLISKPSLSSGNSSLNISISNPDISLKTSKDPRENEILQAVYGTLKRNQVLRKQALNPKNDDIQKTKPFLSYTEASEDSPTGSSPPNPFVSIFPVSSSPSPPGTPPSIDIPSISYSAAPSSSPPSSFNSPISFHSHHSDTPATKPEIAVSSTTSNTSLSPSISALSSSNSSNSSNNSNTSNTSNSSSLTRSPSSHSTSSYSAYPSPSSSSSSSSSGSSSSSSSSSSSAPPSSSSTLLSKKPSYESQGGRDVAYTPPAAPPMPAYRISRRISALRKFDRNRSSKKNSKPPIDIFEGEKPEEGKTDSYHARIAALRSMFENANESPKLPISASDSKLFFGK